jgi:RimJ/RimL family protein N-acetyltransferase
MIRAEAERRGQRPEHAGPRTTRLDLIPYAPECLLALIEGEEQFAASFGVRAAPGLREFLVSDQVDPAWIARLKSGHGSDGWSFGFAAVHRTANLVIGNVGFTGPPSADGVVEIAYGIVPQFQGQGLATEAASAGVAFAFRDTRVNSVCAHTLPAPNPSTRVLEKLGFARAGDAQDAVAGTVWRWTLDRARAFAT